MADAGAKMITLASMGRFHFLEQARALAAARALDRFYCDDPRVVTAAGRRGRWLAQAGLATRWRNAPLHWCGEHLARATVGASLLKINSAFALETLRRGSVPSVWVDHGSLHERHVAGRMLREAEEWGDPLAAAGGNHSTPEILDRQEEEFARAHGIVVASELARQTMAGAGVAVDKIRVVPLAVDARRFAPRPRPEGARPFRILHAGPVTFNKGVHRLIAAFAQARLPDAELWIAGRAPDAAVLGKFRQQAGALPVRFLPPVRQSALPELFSRCDLFVLASLADGFGLTVLQAMACGLPAVVTPECGCAETLRGCAAAAIVPAGDTRALAVALARRYANRGEDRADEARGWVVAWDWDRHARSLQKALSLP